MNVAFYRALLASFAVFLFAGANASAGPGDLDVSFGSGGLTFLAPDTELNAVAVRPDGSTVAVGRQPSGGRQLIAQFSPMGALQSSSTPAGGVLHGVVIQPDGKIVAVGDDPLPDSGIVVRRMNPDGSLDTGFGSGGVLHAVPGGHANAVALGPNGTIVVAGSAPAADSFQRVAILRVTADGRRDPSFGSDGFSIVDLYKDSVAKSVAVQGDGKIVFAGSQGPADYQTVNALIARVNPSGTLDSSFAAGGVFFYYHPHGGASSTFNAVALDPAGGIVAGGGDSPDLGPDAIFARLTCAGTPDPAFGSGGLLSTSSHRNFFGDPYGANAVAVAGSRNLVGAGRFQDSGLASAALWGFDRAGTANIFTKAPSAAEARGIAVATSGKLLVAGTAMSAVQAASGFVARYVGYGSSATGTTPCGGLVQTPPPPPVAPGAPTSATGSARAITGTSATPSGRVNPNGQPTTYYFQYGKDTSYRARATPSISVGSGTAALEVTAKIAGLRTGTRYHYRLVAVNATGTARGADATFTTGPALALMLSRLPRGTLSLRNIARLGLPVSASCSLGCMVAAYLRVDGSSARQLGLGHGPTTIARAMRSLTGRGPSTLRLFPTLRAVRALSHGRGPLAVSLRVVATSRANGSVLVQRGLYLSR